MLICNYFFFDEVAPSQEGTGMLIAWLAVIVGAVLMAIYLWIWWRQLRAMRARHAANLQALKAAHQASLTAIVVGAFETYHRRAPTPSERDRLAVLGRTSGPLTLAALEAAADQPRFTDADIDPEGNVQ